MQLRHLLIFLLMVGSFTEGRGQLFQNRNLYDIWITAEGYVDAGKFGEAIQLYGAAPDVPEFEKRLHTTRRIQTLFQNGERLFRTKKYAEALETFSKYRVIDPNLHVAILDERIGACLQQLEKIAVKKLDASTRIVAGFEYAYKGDRKLSELDTLAALGHYTKARQLGGGLNPTLRDQYQEGLRAVKALRDWGDAYRRALADNDQARSVEVLKAYRSASKYIVSALEYEIKRREQGEREALAAPAESTPGDLLKRYARECSLEEAAYVAKNNRVRIARADEISQTLDEFILIEKSITALDKDPGNGRFLESAYRNLIDKASQVPVIGPLVQTCAKQNYYAYLINLAQINEKSGNETGEKGKHREALRYVVEARQLGLAEALPELDAIQQRVADKLGCEDRQREFGRSLVKVRRELLNCRARQGRKLWDEAAAQLAGCGLDSRQQLDRYLALRDSVYQFYTADSLFENLRLAAKRALDNKECGKARQFIGQMAGLKICNVALLDSALLTDRLRADECERVNCYTSARTKAFQSAENREWKKSYDLYKKAYECANAAQKEKIAQILADLECNAYPERCRRSNVAVSVEPMFRAAVNRPSYIEEGVSKETRGYLASAGIQVSFLSYRTPVDVMLGLEYFQTQYQALGTRLGPDYPAGDFNVSGADAYVGFKLHRAHTDPNRLRPYLKAGLEVMLPFRYSLRNHPLYESTQDRSLLKRQSLGGLGGVGVELQKKKFGFFAELAAGYNFSGLYNANAISSSGARSKTEAHFRLVGLRAGLRFW